jgi:hypothetical protein
MAKKTAEDLATTPLTIAERHHTACQKKLDKVWAEIDAMFDKTGDNLRKGFKMQDLDKKLAEHARVVNELMSAAVTLQRYQRGDIPAPTEPSVPEEDVRAVLIASLDDKTDELQFTVNNGLLASAIAKAIRMDVTEANLTPPLCEDHR